jgi:uncharacterized SAM-binding protein YcdF (DUF218 family)
MGLVEQLGCLSHPVLQAILLAILGMLLLWRRRYRAATGLLLLAMLWLWLCATPAFALWLWQGLDCPQAQTNAATYPKADAIVVLGGGRLPQQGAGWSTDDARVQATRLGFGLQLFRNSRASTMLLSGDDQALKMARKLEQQGIPASALITESASANTHQNALYSAAILKRKKLQRILLVTSDIHMPRASASFTRQGLTVIPAPAPDPDGRRLKRSHPWLPQRAALSLSARCLREYLGLWSYRLRGWA